MQDKAKNIIKYVCSFVLAVFFVWLAVRKIDFKSFVDGLIQTEWIWIGVFVIASIAALVLRALRWEALIKPIDKKVKAAECWDANNVGNVVNVVLPGAGEFVRCGYLRKSTRSYEKILGTVVCERVCDLLAIVVLLLLSFGIGWSKYGDFFNDNVASPVKDSVDFSLWWLAIAGILLIAAAVYFIYRFRETNSLCKKIAGAVKGLVDGFISISKMEHPWIFVLYTFGIWFCYVLMCWCAMLAVPALSGLSFSDALFISAVGNLASIIPVPGGIGAYHYLIMVSLSSIYGIEQETGLLFATLCHEIHSILILILGIISYIAIQFKRKTINTL